MALEEYRRKRDFKQTPEPSGGKPPARRKAKGKKPKGLSFVIQKHAATRLHYDFRLELDGVLKSWAVPKGPSLDPGEKRLAVHVEDHPLDYGDFEGVIPEGQYGGGTVLLWDRGTWEPLGADADADYKKGRLKFRLDGDKLHGAWNLVRMGGRAAEEGKENWLLIKERDEEARPGSGEAIVEERPESVATERSIEEIAGDADRVWESNRPETPAEKDSFKARLRRAAQRGATRAARSGKSGKTATARSSATKTARTSPAATAATAHGIDLSAIPGARQGALPKGGLAPQLATLVSEAPAGPEWLHEIKFDGYRVLCEISHGKARLWTRSRKDWTDHFPPVARAAAAVPAGAALLDGEVVVVEPDGTTSFQALQNALSGGRQDDLVYYVFDLLHLDGWDLRGAALEDRKRVLSSLLAPLGHAGVIRQSDHVRGQGEDFFRQACGFALEGIVSKRGDQPYRPGRGGDWVKTKCLRRQEFVVVGYTDPEGARTGFGALLLAVRDESGELTFAGKVGTGFNDKLLRDLTRRLKKLRRPTPAFANPPRGAEARRSHWVEPELVAEVAFTEWTDEGILRHPSFQGLREDKSPAEVVREEPQPPPAAKKSGKTAKRAPSKTARAKPPVPDAAGTSAAKTSAGAAGAAKKSAPAGGSRRRGGAAEVAGVRLSNPERLLYPGQGLTKLDLARYYEQVAGHILPYVSDRPLTLVRCPEGQARECFYQKHVNDQFPPSVLRVDVGEAQPYGAVNSLAGLVALVQMGVLELHIWGARRDMVEKPDYLVFDLDPDEGLPWERVALGALQVRQRLEELGLRSFLKTTGGKGLHVVVPIVRRLGWDEVKAFTKALAEDIVAREPGLYTSIITKARRKGKVFIDYLRNGRGATSICAYSTRSRPGAPVSVPLFWEELEDRALRGNTYTVENLAARLAGLRSDPWADFFKVRQGITAAARKALGVG